MEPVVQALPPSVVLSAIVGALWTCVYVLVRGQLRLHVLLVLPAAVAGAWAGQALGARLGDPARMGDYPVVSASVFAWVGIGVVSVAATVGARTPSRGDRRGGTAAPDPADAGDEP